ncbi:MAG: prolipoprotein diacylglyceryl transferase [Pseudomonadota bacterium]
MIHAIPFPDIDPVLVSVELFGITLAIRWYALAYIAGFLCAMFWIRRALSRPALWPGHLAPMEPKAVEDLLTYTILGTIIGGRLGYVLFYAWPQTIADPAFALRIWDGGMSFHGGFLGVIAAGALFAWRHGVSPGSVGDCFALGIGFGLFFGRVANFVNGELWGRPTDVAWGVVFPNAFCPTGPCARHPSQLYEAVLEGLLFLLIAWWLAYGRGVLRRPGLLTAIFFVWYGACRTFVEAFRQADDQFITLENPLGHVLRFGDMGLTMGQVLSLPMVLVGALLLAWVLRRAALPAPRA